MKNNIPHCWCRCTSTHWLPQCSSQGRTEGDQSWRTSLAVDGQRHDRTCGWFHCFRCSRYASASCRRELGLWNDHRNSGCSQSRFAWGEWSLREEDLESCFRLEHLHWAPRTSILYKYETWWISLTTWQTTYLSPTSPSAPSYRKWYLPIPWVYGQSLHDELVMVNGLHIIILPQGNSPHGHAYET